MWPGADHFTCCTGIKRLPTDKGMCKAMYRNQQIPQTETIAQRDQITGDGSHQIIPCIPLLPNTRTGKISVDWYSQRQSCAEVFKWSWCFMFNLVQHLIRKVWEVFVRMISKVRLQKFLVKLHSKKKDGGTGRFEDEWTYPCDAHRKCWKK